MATIIEDTRQKVAKHCGKVGALEAIGHQVVRSKLPFGDYALMPPVSVDTKADIYELVSDIDQQHDRFRGELKGAKEAGVALYVLTINKDGVTDLGTLALWHEPIEHLAMRRRASGNQNARQIMGQRIAKACMTMQDRYGVTFLFCSTEEEAADIIDRLLVGDNHGE